MDLAHISRVVDGLAGSAAEELRLSMNGMDLHIRFADPDQVAVPVTPVHLPEAVAPTEGDLVIISAPMPGVIYLAPSPSEPAFVNTGRRVVRGDTLLLIEAMKSLQPLTTAEDGIIEAILVEDGQAVDAGDTMILLRPGSA